MLRADLDPQVYVKEVAELYADPAQTLAELSQLAIDGDLFTEGIRGRYEATASCLPIDKQQTLGVLTPRKQRMQEYLADGGFIGPAMIGDKIIPGGITVFRKLTVDN